ncbi:MAG: energy-coupling factor ABC transporter ATP-binding protein [Promethearchaeota archaeon]
MLERLPLIIIENLSYVYPNGTKALKKINLNIRRGESLAIMGKNGAGKTTLIRTLNGLIKPTQGNIYIDNKNINSSSIATLSQNIGIIFQNPYHQLFANSVEEEIRFSLRSLNLNKAEIELKVNKVLKDYDLEKYRERSPLTLSGGESKKLAVASILCRDPGILIFDEPTLGQDAKQIEFFIDLINEERKRGKTIIIITHNVEFVFKYMPRTIVMSDGKIIADGPTKKILNNEFIVKKASLILPQLHQFYRALQHLVTQEIGEILSENNIIDYIKKFIKEKSITIKEE